MLTFVIRTFRGFALQVATGMLLCSCSSTDNSGSGIEPYCVDAPAIELRGLDAKTPLGEKVSDLITFGWGRADIPIEEARRSRNAGFSCRPDSAGELAQLRVSFEKGAIEYIESKPTKNAFDERVTGKVIRKINPENLDLWKDQQALVVPLELDELDGSFELDFPEDSSKKKRNSAKLVLFFPQSDSGSLNVEWHVKSKSDQGPKTIVKERHEIYTLLKH